MHLLAWELANDVALSRGAVLSGNVMLLELSEKPRLEVFESRETICMSSTQILAVEEDALTKVRTLVSYKFDEIVAEVGDSGSYKYIPWQQVKKELGLAEEGPSAGVQFCKIDRDTLFVKRLLVTALGHAAKVPPDHEYLKTGKAWEAPRWCFDIASGMLTQNKVCGASGNGNCTGPLPGVLDITPLLALGPSWTHPSCFSKNAPIFSQIPFVTITHGDKQLDLFVPFPREVGPLHVHDALSGAGLYPVSVYAMCDESEGRKKAIGSASVPGPSTGITMGEEKGDGDGEEEEKGEEEEDGEGEEEEDGEGEEEEDGEDGA